MPDLNSHAVLRIEELVEQFIKDTTQDVLQFPANYSSYQVGLLCVLGRNKQLC